MNRKVDPAEKSRRRHMHRREIVCDVYEGDDGFWEVEGRLADVKSYEVEVGDRGHIATGDPFHDMRVRLTVDRSLTIRAVQAITERGPYSVCGDIGLAYAKLEGIAIAPGFRRQLQARLGGVHGCRHLSDLVAAMAVALTQAVWHVRDQIHLERAARKPRSPSEAPPAEIDGCHALTSDGETVKRHYPMFYRPTEVGKSPGAPRRPVPGSVCGDEPTKTS